MTDKTDKPDKTAVPAHKAEAAQKTVPPPAPEPEPEPRPEPAPEPEPKPVPCPTCGFADPEGPSPACRNCSRPAAA